MAATRRYRHKVTGLIGDYTDRVAKAFEHVLVEVDDDAKPLAYTPLPQQSPEEYDASHPQISTDDAEQEGDVDDER